jgi:ligand-binding SRPBCC domain-containing protein
MLGRLLPLFRRGLGARLGAGQQYLAWIHVDDAIAVLAQALEDQRYSGSVNLVAPLPSRMSDLVRGLGRAAGRPVRLGAPASLLRLALGESAEALLSSGRVLGTRLGELGFTHAFPDLDAALADLVGQGDAVDISRLGAGAPAPIAGGDYLRRHPPAYLLRSRVTLSAPVDEVFSFFSRPQNLGLLTPAGMSFRIREAPAEVGQGSAIDYSLRVAGAPLRWRTSIEHWAPGRCFVDAQTRGPYRSWWHEHHFQADGARTVMEDRVYFAAPLGPLGRAAQSLFIAPQLREVFGYRSQAIRLRFSPPRKTVEPS